MTALCIEEGGTPRVSGMFYKAVEQAVLLHGCESGVLQTLDNPYYELIGYSIYAMVEDGQTATSHRLPHHCHITLSSPEAERSEGI